MPLATAEAYKAMLEAARTNGFAIPGVAVTSSETLNAALRGFADAESDGIVQISPSAGLFASGSGVNDAATGAIALAAYAEAVADKYPIQIALHTDHCRVQQLDAFMLPLLDASSRHRTKAGRPLFNSQMFDGSDLPINENVDISAQLLKRTSAAEVVLEIEVGVVGRSGTNEDASSLKALTQPSDFVLVAQRLGTGERGLYILAPAFGNVHGVSSTLPGQKVDPGILLRGQEAVRLSLGAKRPLYLAFHGGSGSTTDVIRESIRHGVVKFNVDTDTQFSFSQAVARYVLDNQAQMLGTNDSPASKTAFDTRTYTHNGETAMAEKVQAICVSLLSAGRSIGCE